MFGNAVLPVHVQFGWACKYLMGHRFFLLMEFIIRYTGVDPGFSKGRAINVHSGGVLDAFRRGHVRSYVRN